MLLHTVHLTHDCYQLAASREEEARRKRREKRLQKQNSNKSTGSMSAPQTPEGAPATYFLPPAETLTSEHGDLLLNVTDIL